MTENKLAVSLYGELEHISPAITQKEKPYSMIAQGTITNELTKVTPTKHSQPVRIDNVAKTITYQKGNLSIIIPYSKEFEGLKDSTYHLLDAITREFTRTGERTVILRMADFMELRGLKDKREVAKQINADLNVLTSIKISWESTEKYKGIKSFGYINIAEKGEFYTRPSRIEFIFTQSFYDILKTYNPMPYPDKLFRINSKRHPYSRALGRKIAELKNMDFGKTKEDILTVANLLEQCFGMPTYEEVMKGNRDVKRRIIDPFIRDMDALEEEGICSYHFLHKDNTPLTDKELDRISYNDFITLKVIITWFDYPSEIQVAKLERKAQKAEKGEAIKKKKGRGRPKKNPTN